MSLKRFSLPFFIASAVALFSANGVAQIKTSTLTIAKTSSSLTSDKKLPQQCVEMFNTADKLIKNAEKQPGTHTQVNKMKNKLSQSKKQILKMDTAMQEKSCTKGLVALNNLKKK